MHRPDTHRAVFAALTCSLAIPALAGLWEPPPVVWHATIDTDVDVTLSEGHHGIVSDGTTWFVVYQRANDIVLAAADAAATSFTTQVVSSDPAPTRAPVVASARGAVRVAWESDRTGHSEIYVRTYDAASRTPLGAELCLVV